MTEISLDDVVEILNRNLGLSSYVFLTAGHAVVFAGAWGRPYSVTCGPGTYGWGRRHSTGELAVMRISPAYGFAGPVVDLVGRGVAARDVAALIASTIPDMIRE